MQFEVRALTDDEVRAAGGVAARALRDNPMMVFSVPDDPLGRLRAGYDTFGDRIAPGSVGALVGRHVIGVAAAARPGGCVAVTATPELRRAPDLRPVDAVGYERARFVISTMCDHDPAERHVHVGPVGVEPGGQGLGVGAAMLRVVCERLDAEGEVGWLETDRPENVVFYRRHGFDVDAEDRRLGFPIWFMRRPPG
ncbi:MAG TPA: GNAT family N-acetyltransferase [Acidimicrobiia bacterium]|nr:GNAT family N-acetyltransferase [Acidimicrobiia bacterium]HEV3452303.1 GNAT family N-acetyltransferase [Acidimicrobiia bacterium]